MASSATGRPAAGASAGSRTWRRRPPVPDVVVSGPRFYGHDIAPENEPVIHRDNDGRLYGTPLTTFNTDFDVHTPPLKLAVADFVNSNAPEQKERFSLAVRVLVNHETPAFAYGLYLKDIADHDGKFGQQAEDGQLPTPTRGQITTDTRPRLSIRELEMVYDNHGICRGTEFAGRFAWMATHPHPVAIRLRIANNFATYLGWCVQAAHLMVYYDIVRYVTRAADMLCESAGLISTGGEVLLQYCAKLRDDVTGELPVEARAKYKIDAKSSLDKLRSSTVIAKFSGPEFPGLRALRDTAPDECLVWMRALRAVQRPFREDVDDYSVEWVPSTFSYNLPRVFGPVFPAADKETADDYSREFFALYKAGDDTNVAIRKILETRDYGFRGTACAQVHVDRTLHIPRRIANLMRGSESILSLNTPNSHGIRFPVFVIRGFALPGTLGMTIHGHRGYDMEVTRLSNFMNDLLVIGIATGPTSAARHLNARLPAELVTEIADAGGVGVTGMLPALVLLGDEHPRQVSEIAMRNLDQFKEPSGAFEPRPFSEAEDW